MELLALALFVFSTSGTPGPNNIMLLSSGVNFGIKKSLPHILGVNLGFPIMVIAVGIGLVSLFNQFPQLYTLMKVVGIGYLLFLAFKIAQTPVSANTKQQAKPISFVQAAAFQWVNPKAWIMAISAIVAFSSAAEASLAEVVWIALAYLLFGLPCSFAWLSAGVGLKKVLNNPLFVIWFNRAMAVLLVISIVPMINVQIMS
ncbi:LysE family translocator [Thalassotalea sp. M1531]|uniref:LysE family translocator n=1 Tax=Thalassotalea algicola TaxID=2716224 RepID=A0A7Y0LCV3_9GAMM|nr:LysE family translocator [Thalassotalea algicola]NMP32081.1 LysE family translocator [Thalassotalea algicola]